MVSSARCTHCTRLFVALAILIGLLVSGLGAPGPAQAQATRIIWLHHSCGQNLIDQGGVREGLTSLGYEFFDHGYNEEGLRLADGSYAGYSYDVPDDNTDPDGMAAIFSQPFHDPPDNTFSHLLEYDVILFKSCFPTSNISSDEQLADYQSYYGTIRDRVAQHPDKLFITVTQPPQVPGASEPDEAVRARALADWLQSGEYLAGLPNLATFDFFGYLAGEDGFLRPEYRMDEYDAHPNEQANQEIGPLFVAFIDDTIRAFTPGAPSVPSSQPPTAPTEGAPTQEAPAEPQAPAGEPVEAGGIIDDFEMGDLGWSPDHGGEGTTVTCQIDDMVAHEGAASFRAQYTVVGEGWAGCHLYPETALNWSEGGGVEMWLRSDSAGQEINLIMHSGDIETPTPFSTLFQTTDEMVDGWTRLAFSWSDVPRADWADEGGLEVLDPARIVSFGFGFSHTAGAPGVLWVDDIRLTTGGSELPLPEPTEAAAEEPTEAAVEEPTEAAVEEPTEAAEQEPTEVAVEEPTPAPAVAVEPTAPAQAPASGATVAAPVATPTAAGKSGKGFCPFSIMLPLGAAVTVLIHRRRGEP